MKKSLSGIYAIVNRLNGNRYIGSTSDITQRWRQHRHRLNKNHHHSKHLQSAWNKYGESAFDFLILELVENKNDLAKIEQSYLDTDFPEYNHNRTANSVLGYRFSDELKKKMSEIHTGFRHAEESIKKMSEYWKGRPRGKYSEERRKKISEAHKGKKISQTQKEALDIGRSKPKSPETKKKISDAQKGYHPTQETIEKLKQAWIRRKARKENAKS